ncbi:DUF7144 family membrane protein [Streptomyces poonensis]|uniref:Membrane protein n=1 Tax=Streptomyces poonensis TaxID=68255 RepID=A0A918QE04_9ACTN|nr:hypothetical protein [Streptomyces poonensis]GGZ43465.1 membrane protein [Streptomyces poonensis]GLJ91711.1 membrane protein [Streptomyces poonensis]
MDEQPPAGQTPGGGPDPEPEVRPLVVEGVVLAACLLLIIGAYHTIMGLAAVIDEKFYVPPGDYAYRLDIMAWGWVHVGLGVIVVAAGLNLFRGPRWARVVGIAVASLSAVQNFLFTPYYAVWSVLVIALDVLVIWSLAGYGHQVAHKVYGAPL